MSELQSSFEKLTGQTLTDADVKRLYRIKNALHLGDNDALWLLLMALDYPVTFYEKLPAQMKQASMDVLDEFRTTADAIAKASAEAAKADLAKAVATTAQQVASDVVGVKRSRWVATAAIAIGLGVAVVAGGWLYAYVKGRSDMEITLRAQQPAALTWLGSRAGQRARELSDQRIIDWMVSDAGKRARELSTDGTIEVLETSVGRRLMAAARSSNGQRFVDMMDCRPTK